MISLISIPWGMLVPPAAVAFLISLLGTPVVVRLAKKWNLYDLPSSRRVHTKPMPRLGGIIIWLAIIISLLVFLGFSPKFYGVLVGATLIFLLGLLDDIYSLPPLPKLMGQIFVASVVVLFGITITNLTNPFGGTILLAPFWDVLLTIIWILLVVNTINWLDGLDGLAAGVSGIAAFVLVILSLYTIVNQPQTAALAAIVVGASLGFLYHNWHPAKIFMGDSGSHLLGFMLAILAIISGGKLATAVLVLGLPIIDAAWAVIRRLRQGKMPWAADKEHLHHQLLSLGLGQRGTVLLLYLFAIGFGCVALVSKTWAKLVALVVVIAIMILIVQGVAYLRRKYTS